MCLMSLFISSANTAWKATVKKENAAVFPAETRRAGFILELCNRMGLEQQRQKNYYLEKQKNVSLYKKCL